MSLANVQGGIMPTITIRLNNMPECCRKCIEKYPECVLRAELWRQARWQMSHTVTKKAPFFGRKFDRELKAGDNEATITNRVPPDKEVAARLRPGDKSYWKVAVPGGDLPAARFIVSPRFFPPHPGYAPG
jgi:hypothetical protein